MNQFKDMPPLGPDEAPWADHEVQLRAGLSGAEETPPAGLEARIWEALDAQSFQPTVTNRTPWVAAAIVGSVVVASFWMPLGEEAQEPAAVAPVEANCEQSVEPVQQPSLNQALKVTPSKEAAVDQTPPEGVNEASEAAVRTENEVVDRQELEVMTELESSAIPAQRELNRTPIQSSQTRSDTVRLKGTLKLKQ